MKFKASCEHDRAKSILSNTATEGLPAAKVLAIKLFPFESDLSKKRKFGEYYGFIVRTRNSHNGTCLEAMAEILGRYTSKYRIWTFISFSVTTQNRVPSVDCPQPPKHQQLPAKHLKDQHQPQ